jgi:hypothetical protein
VRRYKFKDNVTGNRASGTPRRYTIKS